MLEITHNVLREWTKIGPGATTLSLVPETTGPLQATIGALVVIARRVRLPAQPARAAAARDARGRRRRRRRSGSASTGSGSGRSRSPARWRASPAACYVHLLGSITTEQVYLELTFLTLAMLVVGGVTSLWGAVRRRARGQRARLVPERGRARRHVGVTLDLPAGDAARRRSARSWRSC